MAGVLKHFGGEAVNAIKSNKGFNYLMGDMGTGIQKNYKDLRTATETAKGSRANLKATATRKTNIEKALQRENLSPKSKERLLGAQARQGELEKNYSSMLDGANRKAAGGITGMGGSVRDWAMGRDRIGNGRALAVTARAGAVAGASVLGGTGIRMVNGGGMTYNNQGERDIAGIPFI